MQPPNGENPFGPTQNPFGPPQSPFNPPAHNPFQGGVNPPATPPKKRSRLWLLLAAVPAITAAACCITYAIASRGHESNVVLDDVCSGQRSTQAAPYVPSALPHRVSWFDHRGSSWSHGADPPVPEEWTTLWADETQLVACAEAPVQQVIERCPFTNGRVIERRRMVQVIRLVVPGTGQVVTQQQALGAPPAPCNSTEVFSHGTTLTERTGPDITEESVRPLLEPFIAR